MIERQLCVRDVKILIGLIRSAIRCDGIIPCDVELIVITADFDDVPSMRNFVVDCSGDEYGFDSDRVEK